MKKQTVYMTSILILVVLAVIFLAACGSSNPTATAASSSAGSASSGQALMQERCTVCHSLQRVTSSHMSADRWKTTVERMVNNGAQLSSQEQQTLVDYLAQNYK
jgi:mono/diheme cytochrome c family protein